METSGGASSDVRRFVWVPLLFAAVSGVLVLWLTVEIPVWDDYALIPPLWKLHTGNFQIADLYFQAAENRPVLPVACLLLLAHWTHWHHVAINLFSLAVLTLFACTVAMKLARHSHAPKSAVWLTVSGLGFLIFSPVGRHLWLCNWYLNNTLGVLLVVWACEFASRRGWASLGVSVLFSILATFSNTNCLALWPSVFVCSFLCAGHGNVQWVASVPWFRVLLWSACALVTSVVYMMGLDLSSAAGTQLGPKSVTGVISYVFQYLGAPFCAWQRIIAIAIGAVGTVLAASAYVFLRRNGLCGPLVTAGCYYCIFALIAAALTAVGREGDPLWKGRYLVTELFFWIGLACLLHSIPASFYGKGVLRRAGMIGLGILLCLATLNWGRSLKHANGDYCELKARRGRILAGVPKPEDLRCLYPDAKQLEIFFGQLKSARLSLYRDSTGEGADKWEIRK